MFSNSHDMYVVALDDSLGDIVPQQSTSVICGATLFDEK